MSQKARFTLLILSIGLFLGACNHQREIQTESRNPHPLLLISFDGFMNEYLDRNETPHFDRFIANGVKAEYMIPIFPTNTFPNHYTLVTGLYAENHGIIANSFYDRKLDAEFSYGPLDSPNDERWWGGEPIWITAKKQGLTSATFFWPGSEATIDGVQSTKWLAYDGSIPDSTRIDSIMTWLDQNGPVKADFGSLYFSFVDGAGHDFGPDSPEVDRAVMYADSLLGYLLDEMNELTLSDSLNVIIVSDHGMAELSSEKVIFLDEFIDLEQVELIDWTPAAMIRPDEGQTQKVYQALKENENNYRVFLKEDLPEHYHFSDHYRIPEIIMIADVGYTISSRFFFEAEEEMGGTHGFDYRAPEMQTIFLATGPDFKKGVISEPFQSVHLYQLMCKLLGIEPAPNDGDLKKVQQMLTK